MDKLKQDLYDQCYQFLEKRIETAQTALDQAREASHDETKSSAGDKYETSREMLQQDMDRNKRLLLDAEDNLRLLKAIDIGLTKAQQIKHGSLVETTQGAFFISVSAGQLTSGGKQVFAVSPASPIGQALLNKKVDEEIQFNGRTYRILGIS